VWLTGGAEEEGARGSGEARPAGRGCAGRAAVLMSSYGAPAWWSCGGGVGGVLLARLRVLLLFALLLLLLLSLSGAATAEGKQGRGWLGFLGGGRGVLMGAALALAAQARTPWAAMPGVRAMATRHASGGCVAGLGFGGVGGRGAGKRGARGRAVTPVVVERSGARAGG
jgi:hypothetical protein